MSFDFVPFPTLTTRRLILREILPGDAADVFSFLSDPIVQKYDVDPVMQEPAQAAAWIESFRVHFENKRVLLWGICLKDENRVIGDAAFMFFDQCYYKTDLGYTLARPYWRQGIMTEAVAELVKFGFQVLRLHRINVDTRMDNAGSVGLMRALGFRHEGTRRECIRNQDGSYQNWGLFGMLEGEYWQSLQGKASTG